MTTQNLQINPNTYYTTDEAAALLRVSRRSVQKLLLSGIAHGVKVGRRWRILGIDLIQLPRYRGADDADIAKTLALLSSPTFEKVWDNDEDSVYDAL